MISFALAFVFGAFCLQQIPALPGLYWSLLCLPLVFADFYLSRSSRPVLIVVKHLLWLTLGFLLGFFWAATLATIRLSDALPHAWENQPIELIGVVSSVSELTERGERFRFDVEKVLTVDAIVPRHISLSFYPADSWGQNNQTEVQMPPRVAAFKAGERWQLTARLKRPHGTQNLGRWLKAYVLQVASKQKPIIRSYKTLFGSLSIWLSVCARKFSNVL
ncbi:MAG: ComEC/Rec2 family competence protein [Methylotenera sp.]|nr:ComEC/Rec2 family competence protein [Methylotenera sp.]